MYVYLVKYFVSILIEFVLVGLLMSKVNDETTDNWNSQILILENQV